MAPINQNQPMRQAEQEIIETLDGLTGQNLPSRVTTLEQQRTADYALLVDARTRLRTAEGNISTLSDDLINTDGYVDQLLDDMAALPFIEFGVASVENVAAAATETATVVFSTAYPVSTVPAIFISAIDTDAPNCSISILNINNVGFQISVTNNGASTITALDVNWMALTARTGA